MCKDAECKEVTSNHTNFAINESSYTAFLTPGLPKTDIFIGAMTSKGTPSLVTQKFTIVVCGYEKINTPLGDQL